MKKPKIGILTTFSNFDSSYSLVSVVRDQLEMHLKYGYEVALYVLPHFEGSVPEGVEVRKVIPAILIEPYKGLGFPDTWQEDAREVSQALEATSDDIDIFIAHDWVFIDSYLPYNIGLREAKLNAKVFHWVHSAPSPRPELKDNPHANRYTLPPKSTLVYLNNDKMVALAEMYDRFPRDVRVVHNSLDPRTFWDIDSQVKEWVDKFDLLSADIVSIYPLSTPRMLDGKQVEAVVDIHAGLKKLGLKTRLIVPNAHCNAEAEQKMVERVMERAKHAGLTQIECVFTSQYGYEDGLPRNMVSDLFRLSNVFIFPSISENCSLVLLEAMVNGNMLVLNKDCSGLQEFGGKNALYFKFGNLDMGTRNEEDALKEPSYLDDIAKIIKSEYEMSKPMMAQRAAFQRFNLDSVFKQIENLYYEQDTYNRR